MPPKRRTPASNATAVSALLAEIDRLKTVFDNKAARRKAQVLIRLAGLRITKASDLEHYHDLLCFLWAYPDSGTQLTTAESELFQFAHRIEEHKVTARDPEANRLADSGIVNTRVSNTFSYDLTRALFAWYPDSVDISWEEYNDSDQANIISFLPLIVSWQENDSIDNDPKYDIEKWLREGSAQADRNSLAMLLHLLETSRFDHPTKRALFENAQIPVKWTLTNSSGSRTLKRLPTHKSYFQTGPLLGRTRDLGRDLRRRVRMLQHLSRTEGARYVRAIKEVLGVRVRELFPLIGSNPTEVYRYQPGRGVEIIVYGNNPDIRLPLESNFGAMLLRNGLPIGYGVAAMLFERAEIAINIFPAFRSGESSFIIESFFHLFAGHFGAKVLLVKSYQVGDDNEEAIESGSFWFYYKLGFRSVKPKVRELAAREAHMLQTKKGYRTPPRILRKLAKSDVFFRLDSDKGDGYTDLSLPNLGYVVSNFIRDHYHGNREQAVTSCVKRLVKLLGIADLHRWSPDERVALERMAPLVCCISGLESWPASDRKFLARIIRAKGSTREKEYVRLTLQHTRFRSALRWLAEKTTPPS